MTRAPQDALGASLVPPHTLELPVPIWGIDPSTKRCSVGILARRWEGTEPEAPFRMSWETLSFSQPEHLGRLAHALRDLLPFFAGLRDRHGRPGAVYVEQPFATIIKGKGGHLSPGVHPQSYYFVGVILCALGHLFSPPDTRLELIDPSSWKKQAMGTGHGGAKKEKIIHWAQSIGWTGTVEDEADAIGIATAGGLLEEQRA